MITIVVPSGRFFPSSRAVAGEEALQQLLNDDSIQLVVVVLPVQAALKAGSIGIVVDNGFTDCSLRMRQTTLARCLSRPPYYPSVMVPPYKRLSILVQHLAFYATRLPSARTLTDPAPSFPP